MVATIEIGAMVVDDDGEVGTVEAVLADPATGAPNRLTIRTRQGRRLEAPADAIAATSTADTVRLTVPASALAAPTAATEERALEALGDRLVVPVREEVLVPTTRPTTLGAVRIHKRVETVPAEALVELTRDDVTVERVPVDRPVETVPAPRQEGETFVIPVVEEVLVTEKRLVVREEIRITRRRVAETVTVRDTVRREVVEIEEPADATARELPLT